MLVGPDRHEHRHADTDLLGVEKRHPLADDAGLLKPLNATPARRDRQTHLARDLGNGLCRVFLNKGEDLAIRCIHGCHSTAFLVNSGTDYTNSFLDTK